jgi:hypothetical protein
MNPAQSRQSGAANDPHQNGLGLVIESVPGDDLVEI